MSCGARSTSSPATASSGAWSPTSHSTARSSRRWRSQRASIHVTRSPSPCRTAASSRRRRRSRARALVRSRPANKATVGTEKYLRRRRPARVRNAARGPLAEQHGRGRRRGRSAAGSSLIGLMRPRGRHAHGVRARADARARTRVAQQQRAIAERVLEHVADGVLLLDPHGIVRFWNHAAAAITGLPTKNVLRQRADRAIPGWAAAVQQIPVGDAHERDTGAASATVPLDVASRGALGRRLGRALRRRNRLHVPRHHRGRAPRPGEDRFRRDRLARAANAARVRLRRGGHAAAAVLGAAPSSARQLLGLLADQANRLSTIIDELLLASKLAGRIDSRPAAARRGALRRGGGRARRRAGRALHAPFGHRDRALDARPGCPRDGRQRQGRAGAGEPRRERA